MARESESYSRYQVFEERIAEIFRTLGFKVTRRGLDRGFDLFIEKDEFPLKNEAFVEIKYYENSVVPEQEIRFVMGAMALRPVRNAIIVTTIGFTRDAMSIGKKFPNLFLVTEAELVAKVTGAKKSNLVRHMAGSYYFPQLSNRLSDNFLHLSSALGKSDFVELLQESLSNEEIANILVEKVPREKLIEKLLSRLGPDAVKAAIEIDTVSETNDMSEKKLRIAEKYESAKEERDPNKKGKLLEEVMGEVIGLVPGLEIVGHDVRTNLEEIDLQVRNHKEHRVWRDFDGMIFIECKNWSKPVGADEIRNFKVKLEHANLHTGIFVALKGITGDAERDAIGTIKRALQDDYKIMVLTDGDLVDILKGMDVSDKVDDKFVALYQ